jgi:prophage DNA circulation protein
MAIARDWLKTLWAASYKGVPFFVEKDDEDGSRRIVEHEFPMRDDPYLEDLGEGVRHYQVTAYVSSDRADAEASSVMQICATRGAGILVLPTHGPILVRCLTFERDRSKDKHGYIGHSLKFTREGFASALASSNLLANLVFMAADNAAASIAAAFVAGVVATGPDFVVAAATDGLQDAVAAIETVRTSQAVEPVASAVQRNEIQALFDAVPELVADPATIATVPQRIVAAARAIGDALDAVSALTAFQEIITDPSLAAVAVTLVYPTPHRREMAINAAQAKRVLLLAALTAYAEAAVRATLGDRPAAITLRADVAEYFEAVLIELAAGEIDLFHTLASLRDRVIDYLSRAIIDLAPVLTVEANLSMPSLFWAWRLYADPNRNSELVARNRIAHPSFMPPMFEARAK